MALNTHGDRGRVGELTLPDHEVRWRNHREARKGSCVANRSMIDAEISNPTCDEGVNYTACGRKYEQVRTRGEKSKIARKDPLLSSGCSTKLGSVAGQKT